MDGQRILKLLATTSCAARPQGRRNALTTENGNHPGGTPGARGTGQPDFQAGIRLGGWSSGTGAEHELAVSELRDREGPSISCVEGLFPYCAQPFSYCARVLLWRPASNCACRVFCAAQPGQKIKPGSWPIPICGLPVENLGQQGDNFR